MLHFGLNYRMSRRHPHAKCPTRVTATRKTQSRSMEDNSFSRGTFREQVSERRTCQRDCTLRLSLLKARVHARLCR